MTGGVRTLIVLCVVIAALSYATRHWLNVSEEVPTPAHGDFRVATYNLGWLLNESTEARYRNLSDVIANLQPHVLAVQEVESKQALLRVLPSGYEVAIADDPLEDQELGLAVRAPFRIVSQKVLFANRRYDYAFPGRRNVLEVELESPRGNLFIYVVHYKSRAGGRKDSDPARKESSRLLLEHFSKNDREHLIVLGDFNDTPGDESLNILETGDPLGGRSEQEQGEFLVNLLQPLYSDDYVTQGFFRQYRGKPRRPVVRGASEDNERLRGRDYNFPNDVKVTEALFDQILVDPALYPSVKSVGVYADKVALEGKLEHITRGKDGVSKVQFIGELPSDHLPVYADLRLR